MRHAVELYFDDATERRFRGLFRELADAGVPSLLLDLDLRPHVTLFVCASIEPTLPAALAGFAATVDAFPARFAHAGSFAGDEGVLFCAPVVTTALLEVHRRAHAELAAHCGAMEPHYLPGAWVPHCTQALQLRPEQVARGLGVCRAALPIEGTFERVGLHRVSLRPRPEREAYPATEPLGA